MCLESTKEKGSERETELDVGRVLLLDVTGSIFRVLAVDGLVHSVTGSEGGDVDADEGDEDSLSGKVDGSSCGVDLTSSDSDDLEERHECKRSSLEDVPSCRGKR